MEKHTVYVFLLVSVALAVKEFGSPLFLYIFLFFLMSLVVYSLRFKPHEVLPGILAVVVLTVVTNSFEFAPQREKVVWVKPLGDASYLVTTSNRRSFVMEEEPKIGDLVIRESGFIETDSLANFFPRLRYKLYRRIEESCDYPVSALIGATTLGIRKELPDSIKCYFLFSGVYHFLAISGLHVTAMIGAVAALFRLFKISRPFTKATLVLLPFLPLTGMPPSLFRAYIFSLLVSVGIESYRRITPLYLLGLVMLLSVMFGKFDLSAALSFLAVLGILLALEGREGKLVKSFKVGFYPMLFTLPVILLKFGTFNPISFINSTVAGVFFTPFLIFSFLNEITLFKIGFIISINEFLGILFIKVSEFLYSLTHKLVFHSEISLSLAAVTLLISLVLVLFGKKETSVFPLLLLFVWVTFDQTKVIDKSFELKGKVLNSFYFISSKGQRFENCTICSDYVFPSTYKFMHRNRLVDKRIIIQRPKRRER